VKASDLEEPPMFKVGQLIRLYGMYVSPIKAIEVHYNDSLQSYEPIVITEGRGDPLIRSLDVIEVFEGESGLDKSAAGYSKKDIESFTPIERAAWEMLQQYEPRGIFELNDNIWNTYDEYTVLELMCNFAESTLPVNQELLEALKAVVDKLDISGNMSVAAKEYYSEVVLKAKAIIQKAEEKLNNQK
jgi:hypothetical protein